MTKIRVKDIKDTGLEFNDTIEAGTVGLNENDSVNFVSALRVKGRADRTGETVLVHAGVEGTLSSFCSRCLKEIQEEWAGKFLLNFPVERNTEYIELDDDIRQEVVLSVPMRLLCSDDCQGLCPECGTNLNEGKCGCAVQAGAQEVES